MDFCIIAISGKAHSGKSTLSNLIKEVIGTNGYGYKIVYVPFAAKIKSIAEDLFFWDGSKEFFYKETMIFNQYEPGEEKVELIQDQGRQLLINVGQKGREIRPTVWADYVCKQILDDVKANTAHKKIYLIDDLRFKNEINSLKRFGSKLLTVRINRDKCLNIDDISEIDLDDYNEWDLKVNNNFTMDQLRLDAVKSIEMALNKSIKRVHCEDC